MPVNRDDVIQAIELVLGRTPDEPLVEYHANLPFEAPMELAEYLIRTDEFRTRYERITGVALGAAMPAPAAAPTPPPPPIPPRPPAVLLGDRLLTTTHRGELIYVPPEDHEMAPHVLMRGLWEAHAERAATAQMRPGGTAVDLGAGVGYHALALLAAGGPRGRVFAFEPDPALMPLLRQTMRVNGLAERAILSERAVMDQAGPVALASAPDRPGSGHVVPPVRDAAFDAAYPGRIEVEAVTLDAALDGIRGVDLLRMDIGGAEPMALLGAGKVLERSLRIGIVMRWSVARMEPRAHVGGFIDWLEGAEFRFWVISPEGALFQPIDREGLLHLPEAEVYVSRQDPA